MCGICGIINFDKSRSVDGSVLKRMCDVIVHRGPDEEGYYCKANVGLGMRRLSIIDLDTGHQPISNEDGTKWIVFNGEIYNFRELRSELEKKGHKFATKSDTEVIIHAYEEYGPNCPTKLNGMFAFAIWDEVQNTLFLARDRIGIKPLYYMLQGDRLVFGSEIKSILQAKGVPREVDLKALSTYLTFEYIPAPLTIFRGMKKLPPAHTLILKDGKVSLHKYWDLSFRLDGEDEKYLCEKLRETLTDSVRLRLVSDVPLGAFLSGGIDSSTVVALMSQLMDQPVKTFSIGFEDATYNELDYARIVAKRFNTDHHEFIIKPNAIELVEKLIKHLDEPFGDFSIFPTYLVSRMARDYVTVALSGDGGDELFGGYETYVADKVDRFYYSRIPRALRRGIISPLLRAIPPTAKKKGVINMTKRFVQGTQLEDRLHHARWMVFFTPEERSSVFSDDVREELKNDNIYDFIFHYFDEAQTDDRLNQQIYVDVKTYLVDDILVKVDRMSMATSLEARVPFLDHRVAELSFSIPGKLKLKGLQKSKYILKKAMEDLLPPEILKRGKQGFSIPIKNWLKKELKPLMLDTLNPQTISSQGFFNSKFINKLVDEHLKGVENHSHQLWALIVFQLWYKLYGKA